MAKLPRLAMKRQDLIARGTARVLVGRSRGPDRDGGPQLKRARVPRARGLFDGHVPQIGGKRREERLGVTLIRFHYGLRRGHDAHHSVCDDTQTAAVVPEKWGPWA
jgi:hypothetical protein